MSNYTKSTDFAAKDALASGDPNKVVTGTGLDTEFNNIQTAVNSKLNSASPSFTGTLSGTGAINLTAEVSVSSASTTDIGGAASNNVLVTGTTGITSFGTSAAGVTRYVRFNGSLTITYNATSMILPGNASITTAANDCLEAESLGAGNWIVRSYTKADGSSLANTTGLRNRIINGDMSIAQRGTTAVTTNATYGPMDRWGNSNTGNTFSTTQGSLASGDTLFDTGGATKFAQVAVTSVANAANFTVLYQPIENVRLLAGKTVTVSFWAKAASGTPLIGVSIDQSFGSGGSGDVQGTGQSVTLSTTWTQYSKTFTIASINGKTLGADNTSYSNLLFWLDAGSNSNTRSGSIGQASKTVSITQVQLEIGPVVSAFEQRPIQVEMALCQRYLYRHNHAMVLAGGMQTSTAAIFSDFFPVTMRTTPTFSFDGTVANWNVIINSTTISITTLPLASVSPTSAAVNPACSASVGFAAWLQSVNSNAYLQYSAEL